MKSRFPHFLYLSVALVSSGFALEHSLPAAHMESVNRAKAAFERRDFSEAARIYEEILTDAPANLYALSNLGVTHFHAGKPKLAEDALRRAIAVAPSDDFSYCTLGIVLYTQGRYDDAMNVLTRALFINPKNASAHRYSSLISLQKGWDGSVHEEQEGAEALDPTLNGFPNLGDFLTPLEKSRLQLPKGK